MAMPVSSVFTGPERRKKLVTYGRAARLNSTQIFADDAPSPERPRKQAGRFAGAAVGAGNALDALRIPPTKSPALCDEFDVPFDNEPTPRAVAVKKALPKPAPKPVDDFDVFDVPSSGDERSATKKAGVKTAQSSRKGGATRPKALVHGKKETIVTSSDDLRNAAPPAARTRAKTPVLTSDASRVVQSKAPKQSAPVSKAASKPTAIHSQVVVQQKKAKPRPTSPFKKTVPTPPAESDVFDVPSSDEGAPARTPIKPRPAPILRAKAPAKPPVSQVPLSPEPSAESDTSNASHKRKRATSVSSSSTIRKTDTVQRKREASVPHRNKKSQRKEDSLSPGYPAHEYPQSTLMGVNHGPPINKPKRTRTRTVPVMSRTPIMKAQSSPIKLHDMLAMRSAKKPSPVQEALESTATEDETMYDIQDEATPLARAPRPTLPGSVTPQQRTLFSNLLEDDSDLTTPMPSISKLQLTDRKPGSVIASLARSSSDVPQSSHTRKGKLLDMLKRAAPSSDEGSESEEESDQDTSEPPPVSAVPKATASRHFASQEAVEAMDVDTDTQMSSQASRAAISIRDGPRLTYAKQRSYLEESNIEDGLLNWDDDIEVAMSDRQGSVTGSEDDSQQVTGLPELRRKGQLYKFEAETQAMIEDISGKSNTNISARRSAMMEFASQMADEGYVQQLLESAMTSSLLRAITATGDMIFDFAAAVAVLFMLRTRPSYAVVEHVYQSDILSTIRKLLSSNLSSLDIHRISKERKTNMAQSARETVAEFRVLVLKTCDWPAEDLPKLSPQLIAVKVLEELVIGLRTPGNTESIADEELIGKVLDAASGPSSRGKAGKATPQDQLVLDITFSALESLSISKEGQATWPNEILRRLADMMSASLEASRSSPIRLVIRLCMNLTNSKPSACQIFADETFVSRLTGFIVKCFRTLEDDASQEPTTGVREDLILGLGAMINLAEFSDQARLNVVRGGDELIGELVRIFLEGSERADRADSVEESQSSVLIGYLSILLGNLCLNDRVRRKVTALLPGKNIRLLVQKVREFVQYNQRLDRWTSEFEGAEGEQTLKNFTLRLMLVVERLEEAGV